MRFVYRLSICVVILVLCTQLSFPQSSRIQYNHQQLFLSGTNLAWQSFASDINNTNAASNANGIASTMLTIHRSGGNVVRWWLHTDGVQSPEFDGNGYVIGPGQSTIQDIRRVLDYAWDREIGVDLCLWSFDMLKTTNSTALNRNLLLLNDTNYTRAYINNCLIPMVDSLKGHHAIVAWEIFNEPEGMSTEFHWTSQYIPMAVIQRFINLCAGAIHRTDTTALVTNGSWSFFALSDIGIAKSSASLLKLNSTELQKMAVFFEQKYRVSMTPDEIMHYMQKIEDASHINYYRDDRLIAAGNDPQGILDFYSVHYYSTSTPPTTSPFNFPANHWGLNKPIVVAEFAMDGGSAPRGIPKTTLFDTLYHMGYAGALPWSWTDVQYTSHASVLAGVQSMWDNHRQDVDVNGTGGDFPYITITNPQNGAQIEDTTQLIITVSVADSSSSIISVKYFISDAIKIGEVDTLPYAFTWTNIPRGSYSITAIAFNSVGHSQGSNAVLINVGMPSMTRLEAEAATRSGPGMTIGSGNGASNNAYVNVQTSDTTAKITWQIPHVPTTGTYPIAFGYMLNYDSPKSQFINVNGVRAAILEFTAASKTTWYEKIMNVDLLEGSNTIQMQISWGWMYVDYLAVPTSTVVSVAQNPEVPITYSLDQNFPNPFNPSTTIQYSIPTAGLVKLTVYDLLGRQVAVLVDKELGIGSYSVPFNGSALASGIYFYKIKAGTFTQIKKMIVLK